MRRAQEGRQEVRAEGQIARVIEPDTLSAMPGDFDGVLASVTRAFRERNYEEAARAAESIIRDDNGGAAARAAEALLGTPGLQPFFPNTKDLLAAEPYYSRVQLALERALGADDERVARHRTRLAHIVSARGQYDEAARLLAQSYSTLVGRSGPSDPQTMALRTNLATQYRLGGHEERADALYADVVLCDHLLPLQRDLLSQGARVFDVSQPWSDRCRLWMYFADVVLDVDVLKARLNLPACVEAHRHRGTVDGAEQGLVCTIDYDAVMGLHPDVAPATTRWLR